MKHMCRGLHGAYSGDPPSSAESLDALPTVLLTLALLLPAAALAPAPLAGRSGRLFVVPRLSAVALLLTDAAVGAGATFSADFTPVASFGMSGKDELCLSEERRGRSGESPVATSEEVDEVELGPRGAASSGVSEKRTVT